MQFAMFCFDGCVSVSVNGGGGASVVFFLAEQTHECNELPTGHGRIARVFLSSRTFSSAPARFCFVFFCLHRSSLVVARSTSGGADKSRMSRASLVFMGSHLPVCRGLRCL